MAPVFPARFAPLLFGGREAIPLEPKRAAHEQVTGEHGAGSQRHRHAPRYQP